MNGRSQIVEAADRMEFRCKRGGVMLFTKPCQQSWSGVIISKSVENTSDKRMNARMIPPKGGEDADLGHDGTRGVMT